MKHGVLPNIIFIIIQLVQLCTVYTPNKKYMYNVYQNKVTPLWSLFPWHYILTCNSQYFGHYITNDMPNKTYANRIRIKRILCTLHWPIGNSTWRMVYGSFLLRYAFHPEFTEKLLPTWLPKLFAAHMIQVHNNCDLVYALPKLEIPNTRFITVCWGA